MSSGPGITVPPPIIYLVALLVGIGLQRLWPTAPDDAAPRESIEVRTLISYSP